MKFLTIFCLLIAVLAAFVSADKDDCRTSIECIDKLKDSCPITNSHFPNCDIKTRKCGCQVMYFAKKE